MEGACPFHEGVENKIKDHVCFVLKCKTVTSRGNSQLVQPKKTKPKCKLFHFDD